MSAMRVLVNPVAEVARPMKRKSAPLRSLTGRRVALLSNGKWNAAELLDDLASLLQQRHGAAVSFRYAKKHYNHELGPDALDRVATTCDLALIAIGD